MKKILIFITFLSLVLLSGCNFLGTEETETTIDIERSTYIKITTVNQLKSMDVNKSYELDNDLDLNFEEWTPIGTFQNPFRGHFNGNGYTISNLTITKNNDGYNGLFGHLEGHVENLIIENFSIDFTTEYLANVGLVAGFSSGSIKNVSGEGNISVDSTNSNLYIGLLAGSAQTKLDELVIAKEFRPKKISDNNVSGNITIEAEDIIYAGGMIGKAYNIIVENNIVDALSLSVLNANSSAFVGGLIGHNFLYDVKTIEDTLSVNKELVYENIVNADFNILSNASVTLGGLIGYNQNVSIINNFVSSEITLSSETFNSGLLIGETWVIDVEKNLALNTSVDLIATDYYFSTISGRLYQSEIVEGFYYLGDEDVSLTLDLQGLSVVYSELISNQFYLENFPEIDGDFIDLIKLILLNE